MANDQRPLAAVTLGITPTQGQANARIADQRPGHYLTAVVILAVIMSAAPEAAHFRAVLVEVRLARVKHTHLLPPQHDC